MSVQSKIIAEIKRLSEQHIKDVGRMVRNITDCMEAVKDRAAACYKSISFLLEILTEIADDEAHTEAVAYSMEPRN